LSFFLLASLHIGRLALPLAGHAWPAAIPRLLFQLDPLAGILGALGRHGLVSGFWWILIFLLGTLIAGRFFCGWLCPLGTLNQLFSRLRFFGKRGKQSVERNNYRAAQKTKYYILLAGLLAALAGSSILGWLDPLAIVQRSVGFAVWPAAHQASDAIVQTTASISGRNVGTGIRIEWNHTYLGAHLAVYRQNLGIALLFLAILLANAYITRFWCRVLCPLGALLGTVSRFSILRLKKDEERCNKCQSCMLHCQGGDQPRPGLPWRKSECHLCLNCVNACPTNCLSFEVVKPQALVPAASTPDLNRRAVVTSAAAGLVVLPVLRTTTSSGAVLDAHLIRPPGAAGESDFLSRCIRCGNCMRACPTNALQPALLEGGIEGLWTPVLAPRIGYCSPECTTCTEVCPTGAIERLTAQQKGWAEPRQASTQPVRLGTAFYDYGRCLPWASGVECSFCEKACPVTPKAIYFETAEFVKRTGETVSVNRPRIDLARCIGCGACEHFCVLRDQPAISVSRIGESRAGKDGLIVNGVDLTRSGRV
jgi:MauM/NapG family ferredoxin protein